MIPRAALLLGAALFASCGAESREPPANPGATIGPDVRLATLPGIEEALTRARGQALLLNFWAIWCGPCVEELPELDQVHRAFLAKGGRVLGISYELMVPGADRATGVGEVQRFPQG